MLDESSDVQMQPTEQRKRFAGRFFWPIDPAHRVLFLSIGIVLIAGIILVTFTMSLFGQPLTSFTRVATGPTDLNPHFPPPGGGRGSGTTSQPPILATPVLQTRVMPTATTTAGAQFTLHIVSIPPQVNNYSTVPVSVSAGVAGVTVALFVSYDAPPLFYQGGALQTDSTGNVILFWRISVAPNRGHIVTAQVRAIGQDQNGQTVSSQTITVKIFVA